MSFLRAISSSPRLFLLLVISLLTIPWFFFGVQLQDMGWALTKSWMIVESPGEAYWDVSWLSSLIPGLWMEIGEFSLLWMRYGYLVFVGGTFLMLLGLLSRTYQPVESVIALTLTYMLMTAGFNTWVPDYYVIPPIFGIGAIFAFHRAGYSRGIMRQTWLVTTGVAVALLLQARFPSIFLLLLFPAIIGVRQATRRSSDDGGTYRWRDLATLASGVVIGTGGMLLLLAATGDLSHAVSGILASLEEGSSNSGADNIHHPLRLLADTATRYLKALIIGGVILGGIWVADRALFSRKNELPRWTVPIVVIVGASTTLYLAVAQIGMFPPSIGIITLVSFLLLMREWKRGWSDRLFLTTSGILYMITMNAGSSNPQVGSLKFTILLIAPIILMETFRSASSKIQGSTRARLLGLILCVNIPALWFATRTMYGVSILDLTERFEIEGVEGVYFLPEFVNEVESVITGMKLHGVEAGDTTLFYVDIPMFHFLTRTVPAFENSWISSYAVGYPSTTRIRELISEMGPEGRLPKYVLRAPDDIAMGEGRGEKIRLLDSIWGSQKYDTLAELGRFTLLRRPVGQEKYLDHSR